MKSKSTLYLRRWRQRIKIWKANKTKILQITESIRKLKIKQPLVSSKHRLPLTHNELCNSSTWLIVMQQLLRSTWWDKKSRSIWDSTRPKMRAKNLSEGRRLMLKNKSQSPQDGSPSLKSIAHSIRDNSRRNLKNGRLWIEKTPHKLSYTSQNQKFHNQILILIRRMFSQTIAVIVNKDVAATWL